MELYLKIDATGTTPLINFDGTNGILCIEGREVSESILLLCKPVVKQKLRWQIF